MVLSYLGCTMLERVSPSLINSNPVFIFCYCICFPDCKNTNIASKGMLQMLLRGNICYMLK